MSAENAVLLELRFNRATEIVRSLTANYSSLVQLEQKNYFYALYKQGTVGSCHTTKPPFYNAVARARWDLWSSLYNMSKEQAKTRYIELTLKVLRQLPEDDSRRNSIQDLLSKSTHSLSNLALADSSTSNQAMQPLTTSPPPSATQPTSTTPSDAESQEQHLNFTASGLQSPMPATSPSPTSISPSNVRSFQAYEDMAGSSMDHNEPVDKSSPLSSQPSLMSSSHIHQLDDSLITEYTSEQVASPLPSELSSAIDSTFAAEAERALTSLQTQIAALNERIDLLRRDIDRSSQAMQSRSRSWRAILRSSFRHFAVNLFILTLIFLFPYWRRIPYAMPISNTIWRLGLAMFAWLRGKFGVLILTRTTDYNASTTKAGFGE
ncbi:Acyl-CoA binding domain containing 5 [Dimargaris verticillata]|uniref:Acyl-CoA binding domain containing 5 n=1 Tax=Dimargaris verticillata TaxID=2761393 RepID=A0A9W8EDG4_9FUNG|nr:Acyl-CoA binding domain containing 5 [Dimargaris verticillata]